MRDRRLFPGTKNVFPFFLIVVQAACLGPLVVVVPGLVIDLKFSNLFQTDYDDDED